MKREELKLRSDLLEKSKLALDKMMTDNSFSGNPEAEKLMSVINSQIHKIISNPTPTLAELLAKYDPSASYELDEWEGAPPVGKEIIVDSYSLNEFHYHEVLDRTYIELCNLENSLGEHPVIESQPELQKLYDEAFDKLGELYQKVGSITASGDIASNQSTSVSIEEMKETIKNQGKTVSDKVLKKSIEDGRK